MLTKSLSRIIGFLAIIGGIVVGGFGSPEPGRTVWPTVFWFTMPLLIGIGIYLLVRKYPRA